MNNTTASTSALPKPSPANTSRFNQNPTANPDRPSANNNNNTVPPRTGVVQPTPQALPKRSGPNAIIVSPRQKGNPLLSAIKSVPWEYGDIAPDYLLGQTTCALFLSLKYHRLHPEYIYTRIKNLQGKYLLRIILVMVDIEAHEASLRELSKTSLINNVTLILCWSAAEGGRYLELFKTYEHASPSTALKNQVSTAYADRMLDFATVPRSVNKTDAVSLVSQFGSLRTAVNAPHESVAGIAGWGEKKVQRWCKAVREPFRTQKAKRQVLVEGVGEGRPGSAGRRASSARPESAGRPGSAKSSNGDRRGSGLFVDEDEDEGRDNSIRATIAPPPGTTTRAIAAPAATVVPEIPKKRKPDEDPVSDGVMAALSKLRKEG